MASAEELVAHIEVGKSQVGEDRAAITQMVSGVEATVTQITAAKSHAEELSQQLQGMNISDKASQALEVASKLDEAIAQAGIVKSQAEQVNTAADGVNAKLDEAIAAAQSLMGLSHGGSSGSAHPAPPNRTNTSDRGLVATTGEPLQPPQGGPETVGDLQKELAPTDDDDSKLSKFRRFGRAAIRGSSDIKEQAATTASARFDKAADFDPPTETYATVGAPPPIEIHGVNTAAPTQDIVSNSILVAVFAVEGMSRVLGRKRSKRS